MQEQTGIVKQIYKEAEQIAERDVGRTLTPASLPAGDLIAKSRISLSEKLLPPEICLSLIDGDKSYILFTLGNFSMITGKAKSKKTFFLSMLIAGLLRQDALYGKIRKDLPANKKRIIVFDTEQSRYKVQQVGRRICTLAEVDDPADLELYSLRAYPPEKRVEMIEEVIYSRRQDIAAVFIDGIRDLIYDINDPKQAIEIATKLLKWTEDLNIHLCTVLHQNKGDNTARGHLGTELTNKAEVTLTITKHPQMGSISIVEPEYCREVEFPAFSFTVGESGLPYLTDSPDDEQAPAAGKGYTPFTVPEDQHRAIIRRVFASGQPMRFAQMKDAVKVELQGQFGSGGDNKARDFITYYQRMEWLAMTGTPGTKYALYNLKGTI